MTSLNQKTNITISVAYSLYRKNNTWESDLSQRILECSALRKSGYQQTHQHKCKAIPPKMLTWSKLEETFKRNQVYILENYQIICHI